MPPAVLAVLQAIVRGGVDTNWSGNSRFPLEETFLWGVRRASAFLLSAATAATSLRTG